MSKADLTVDLHAINKNSRAIDEALNDLVATAINKRLRIVEIIPGKGSGQLMKQVKRFLQQPDIKQTYKRVEIDSRNHGRLFVYFRQLV